MRMLLSLISLLLVVGNRLVLADSILKGIKANASKTLGRYKGCLLTNAHVEIKKKEE